MEKNLLVLFALVLVLVSACKKTEDTSPATDTQKTTDCLQQSATNYDSQGSIISQSLYYYSDNRLDSIVSVSGDNRTILKYTYTKSNERIVDNIVNGIDTEGHTLQKLDSKGNVIEAFGVLNGEKGNTTKYSFSCN